MDYHVAGIINCVLSSLAVTGVWLQLRLISQRRAHCRLGLLPGQRPTDVLSVNRFVTSFMAWFAFLVFGATQLRFNHYLVWPRVLAVLLTLIILFELVVDRRNRTVWGWFLFCVLATAGGFYLVFFRPPVTPMKTLTSNLLVAITTVVYVQGALAQIWSIRRSGRTGGLSLAMHVLCLAKDLSSTVFGIVMCVLMGVNQGWPVVLMGAAAVVIQATTMWHFRWAKVSDKALKRRMMLTPAIAAPATRAA